MDDTYFGYRDMNSMRIERLTIIIHGIISKGSWRFGVSNTRYVQPRGRTVDFSR